MEKKNRSSIPRALMALGVLLTCTIWGGSGLCLDKGVVPPTITSDAPLDEMRMAELIQEVDSRIRESIALEERLAAEQPGMPHDELEKNTARLKSLRNIRERHLTALRRKQSLEKEKELLQQGTGDPVVQEKPPYSLSLFDTGLDRLASARQKEESAALAANLAKKQIREAEKNLSEIRQEIRRLGKSESPTVPGSSPVKERERRQLMLEEEIAKAALSVETLHLENLVAEHALIMGTRQRLENRVEWLRSNLAQDREELDNHLKRIAQSKQTIETRIKTLIQEQKTVERTWLRAQAAYDRAREDNAPRALARSEAFLKEREAWRETYRKVLTQTEKMLELLHTEEEIWVRRHALIGKAPDLAAVREWQKENRAGLSSIEYRITLQQKELAHLQTLMSAVQKQLLEKEGDPTILRHENNRLRAVEKLTERTLEFLSALLNVKQLSTRLSAELELTGKGYSIAEKVRSLGAWAGRLWNFELWVIDDQGVTVKKVTMALMILIIGIIIVRAAIASFIKRLLSRVHLDENATAAIEKLLFYAALIFIALFALKTVNIPLTAFTFLGGAIAIGAGFGAQNLINNFISGFIIMLERPIKIGDMIEVKETFGTIEEIGARCTRIRTAGNVHILVPNSSFLEKEITNWTLSDHRVRARISVGVAYGSDTRKVEELMKKAAGKHKKVLGNPEPLILFDGFGDNALVFEVYFWIRIARLMDRKIIESDIRFHIESLFRDAGIVVAFPQRDVHLNMQKPLRIEMSRNIPEKVGSS